MTTSKQRKAPAAATAEAPTQPSKRTTFQNKSTIDAGNSQTDGPEVFQLETRYHPKTGKFQIRIDGRWRQRRSWWDTCFHCWRERGEKVHLEYYGCLAQDGTTTFWSMCPECGDRSSNDWIRRPRERQPGGWQHGWLASRRARTDGFYPRVTAGGGR